MPHSVQQNSVTRKAGYGLRNDVPRRMVVPMSETATLNKQVSQAIRIELARRDKSQVDLAKMCGWTAPAFSRRMNGEVPWSTDELDKIAFVLSIPVTDLTNPVQR